ncbi:hypothetical protein [Neorhodopirellula pilleata]|uniref:Carboxypeptidase regulatory-like domain-containing protein n=1 Tax=Neorhodopirellula pilleata TaxID=2714738 RepID=A0A5C6A146_9BACT|nr:hypothetical protein [Neorhodopirellula pilleata]TWT93552.1 hypothetical protein Pla100_40700 [Neorhodopirellula pilleata]
MRTESEEPVSSPYRFQASRGVPTLLTLGLILSLVTVTACHREPTRSGLVAINGTVLVDDTPASGVTLTLHPVDNQGVYANGTTDDQGNLVVSTYDLGDGAVSGTYQVSFTWGEFDPVSRSMTDDRLGGRYEVAKDSGIVWEIEPDQTFQAGTIELKSNR